MVSFEFFVFRGMFYRTLAAAPDKLGLKDTVTYTIMPEGDDEAKCRKWMTGLHASLPSFLVSEIKILIPSQLHLPGAANIKYFAALKNILRLQKIF